MPKDPTHLDVAREVLAESGVDKLANFSRDELLWITLGLAWARTYCAKSDDPVLVGLFEDAADALKRHPRP